MHIIVGGHYTWTKVVSTVHNIIIGNMWIDQVSLCTTAELVFHCSVYSVHCGTLLSMRCVQKRANVYIYSCLIFPHSHTTIMLLGGNVGLVLPVGIVVCRELPSHLI